MIVCDREWIEKYQRIILWFCNAPVVKYWFRYKLRIFHAIPFGEIVERISDCSFRRVNRDGSYTEVFYTHPKISKRLYYGFLPVWKLFHWWDTEIDRELELGLNLGFDTTDYYAAAGEGGTSVDGSAFRIFGGTTFTSFRTGNGTSSEDTSAGEYLGHLQSANSAYAGSAEAGPWSSMYRGKITFPTSSLDALAKIQSQTLNLFFFSKTAGLGGLDAQVCNVGGATNSVVAADYQSVDGANYATISYASFLANYNAISLSGGVTKAGITKYGFRLVCDATATPPAWIQNKFDEMAYTSADHVGTSNDPYLEVVYLLPSIVIKISGDNQKGYLLHPLDSPLVVMAEYSDSTSVPGATMAFSIATYPTGATGQAIDNSSPVTDINGQASVNFTMGDTPGTYTITAAISGFTNTPVTFTETTHVAGDPMGHWTYGQVEDLTRIRLSAIKAKNGKS